MSTITKEWLQQKIASMESTRDEIPFGLDEDDSKTLAALCIVLESLEVGPVAWTDADELRDARNGGSGYLFAIGGDANKFADPRRQLMLYVVPPAPVSVPTFEEWCKRTEKKPVGWVRDAMKEAYEACRAAMLQGAENTESRCTIQTAPALDSLPKNDESSCGNSPAIPDGCVLVPKKLTAENGAKGVLSGEFSETKSINCPECFGDDDCETCDGSGRIEITVPVTWTTIKAIWAKGVEHLAAAPQQEV
jgi:hypothetical protein